MADVELSKYEEHLFEEARRGNYNPFTSYFFQLDWSGTWYTPEDNVEIYQRLHELWKAQGKPDKDFRVMADGRVVEYKLSWGNYGVDPEILYPHGYILIPWGQNMLHAGKMVAVVEGGTGSAKTSTIGVAMLMFMAIYPGFDCMNAAPTGRQSTDMLEEIVKWCTGTRYERLVIRNRNGDLFNYKPHPLLKVDAGLGTYSTFMCQTLGGDLGNISGNSILGMGKDWINIDEAALIYDIEESLARLITRYRGTRRDGRPRYSRPAFSGITNPHENAQWGMVKDMAIEAQGNPDSIYFFTRPKADDNIYITAQQRQLHRTVLSVAQQERWLDGDDSTYAAMGTIPMPVIIQNQDKGLDQLVEEMRESGGMVELNDMLGLVRYRLPADEHCSYLVFGDPGSANPTSLNDNNVPVVGAWDVTAFPESPARLVCLHVLRGEGLYDPWISSMIETMLYYSAVAVYDSTGMGKAMSEWPDLQNMPLYPVTLSGNNKATARTMFLLFAGRGLFAWPYIKMLWYQARTYRESGPGTNKLPDDILSCMFISSFYMRAAFWSQLAELFHWDQEQVIQHPTFEAVETGRTRYARRGGRYRRSRIQTSSLHSLEDTLS
jgi:hypothetical protein